MQTMWTLIQQTLIMFILAGIGFALYKTHKISDEGSKSLGNTLIYIILPAVIVNGFMVEMTTERVWGLLISTGLSALALILSAVISRLCFRKDMIAAFGGTFSNPGFFGVPLVIALLGGDSVFYMAPFIALLNILQFSYGAHLLNPNANKLTVKRVLTAPFMIATVLGFALFFSQLQLPQVLSKSIKFLADANTPLGMFTVGIYMAQTDILKMFLKIRVYLIALVRQIIIPLIFAALLCFVPETWHTVKVTVLIAAAAPVGANIAVYAQLYKADHRYAVEAVVVSTLLAILTLPCIVAGAEAVWKLIG